MDSTSVSRRGPIDGGNRALLILRQRHHAPDPSLNSKSSGSTTASRPTCDARGRDPRGPLHVDFDRLLCAHRRLSARVSRTGEIHPLLAVAVLAGAPKDPEQAAVGQPAVGRHGGGIRGRYPGPAVRFSEFPVLVLEPALKLAAAFSVGRLCSRRRSMTSYLIEDQPAPILHVQQAARTRLSPGVCIVRKALGARSVYAPRSEPSKSGTVVRVNNILYALGLLTHHCANSTLSIRPSGSVKLNRAPGPAGFGSAQIAP